MKITLPVSALIMLAAASLGPRAHAQWIEQTVELDTGWNSIFLEVEPSPGESDLLFAGHPIDKVWMRAVVPSVVIAPDDCPDPNAPDCRRSVRSDWRVWVPSTSPDRPVSNLPKIRGGRAYMILASAPTVLNVTGKPVGDVHRWSQGFNLAGFHIDPENPPSFDSFMDPSTIHDDLQVYDVQDSGDFDSVATSDAIGAGRAYWVKATGAGEYDGPVEVGPISRAGVHFASDANRHSLILTNLDDVPRSINATLLDTNEAPAGEPIKQGAVPLQWYEIIGGVIEADEEGNLLNEVFKWHNFSEAAYPSPRIGPFSAEGERGSSRTIAISVDRLQADSAATIDTEDDGVASSYQGVLEIKSDAGYRRFLSTRMESERGIGAIAGGSSLALPGLWVGAVRVNQVSWQTADSLLWTNPDELDTIDENDQYEAEYDEPTDSDTTSLRPTASEFVFHLIIHLDGNGQSTLLTQINLLNDDNGTPDTPSDDTLILATPSCTDCDQYEPAGSINGEPFSQRITTTGYAFDGDLSLSGLFGSMGSLLQGEIVLEPSHRLNPFRHKYHPDHDCVNSSGEPNPGECYTLTRALRFEFDDELPSSDSSVGWGTSYVTGVFGEVLTISLDTQPIPDCGCVDDVCVNGPHDGLTCTEDTECECQPRKEYTTNAAGTFRLTRVSDIASLNGE